MSNSSSCAPASWCCHGAHWFISACCRCAAPADPAFAPPNESPLEPDAVIPLLVPMVADTDFWYRLSYGGWGLSGAEAPGRLFASTFHRTLEYDRAARTFGELAGCSGGVSAMVFSPAAGALYLARFAGVGLEFVICEYLPGSGAACSPHAWGGLAPEFVQIRALGASDDGRLLYVAEAALLIGEMNEDQVGVRLSSPRETARQTDPVRSYSQTVPLQLSSAEVNSASSRGGRTCPAHICKSLGASREPRHRGVKMPAIRTLTGWEAPGRSSRSSTSPLVPSPYSSGAWACPSRSTPSSPSGRRPARLARP